MKKASSFPDERTGGRADSWAWVCLVCLYQRTVLFSIKEKAIPTLSAKECGYKLLLVRVGTPGRKERFFSLMFFFEFSFRRFDHIGDIASRAHGKTNLILRKAFRFSLPKKGLYQGGNGRRSLPRFSATLKEGSKGKSVWSRTLIDVRSKQSVGEATA